MEPTTRLDTASILSSYFSANRCVEKEFANEPLPVKGQIPAALRGTLYRNGNGRFVHQGIPYDHLFDGDGMIASFTLSDAGIQYSNRYVRTREFVAEEQAGKMLYRGFGINLPGGIRTNFMKMRFKNTANTSLIWHAGQLLALWEGGLPHRIDPQTLDTLDRYDYGGVLQNRFSPIDRLINPELPFSAHPKVHPDTGVLHNFGTAAGMRQRLVMYEVQPDGQARISQTIPLSELIFTHDFVLTQSGYRIFFLTPVSFDVFRAFTGLSSPVASIRVDRRKPTKVLVVAPDGRLTALETDFCFVFHFVNGYEQSDRHLVVDALTLPDFPSAESTKGFLRGEVSDDLKGQVWRYRLDLERGRIERERLTGFGAELPNHHPGRQGRPYRYAWSISSPDLPERPILDGLLKLDVQSGETAFRDLRGSLPGEPLFVPAPEGRTEDEGWLLYTLFDAEQQKTELVIADAANLSTLATARLPYNIPLGFHGLWLQEGEA